MINPKDGEMMEKSCFGAYDIRGIYPAQVNEQLAYSIGRAFPALIKGRKIVVGRDVRLSGASLEEALVRGMVEAGAEVVNIGLVGTEMIYFAVPHLNLDGGIMITASHNPKEYNGMKFVMKDAAPLPKKLFTELEKWVREGTFPTRQAGGSVQEMDILSAYVVEMLSYIDITELRPYKVVVNAGNGAAGAVLDVMEYLLPFKMVKLGCKPDGNFPQGVPNPMLPENQAATAEAVKKHGADFGVAWDGDFDRCFVYDDKGRFIDSCYMVSFLAEAFLTKEHGAGIVYDPRAVFGIEDVIEKCGGKAYMSQGGHVFFKRKMRETGAVYGGEMSAHHYFRDFHYCDSGMIPWLLMAELLSRSGKKLSELLDERIKEFPVSGEQNLKVEKPKEVLVGIENLYREQGIVTKVDGLSIDFGNWRFNLRCSNTESLLRLNVESRGDKDLCIRKSKEIQKEILCSNFIL